jgi:serine protease Do
LGVSIVEIDAELARELNVPLNGGVLVDLVSDGSPAEEAGLREKDIVVAFDDTKVRSTADLQEVVERSGANSRHELKILRDGKPQTLQIVLKTMPDSFETDMMQSRLREDRSISSEFYQHGELGLTVKNLTRAFADQLGYTGLSGALIVDVEYDQLAARAGLREGMLITRVGDKEVENVAEFRNSIEKESLEEGVELEIHTASGSRVVKLKSR